MRAARMAFWLLLLTLMPSALSAQWRDGSAVASLVPVGSDAGSRPPADTPSARRTYEITDPAVAHAEARAGKGMLKGALIGAAVGAAAFLYVEVTKEHWDHSEDGLIFGFLTITGTTVGALLGLITTL